MPIELNLHGPIAEILIAHPPVNALDCAGWARIPALINEAASNEAIRCILIRAEGKGFCGGVDIKQMQAEPDLIVELNRHNYHTLKSIRDAAVPVVGALHGYVIGGGVNIAGACDALIAAEGGYFSLPEIDRGAMGGAAALARMLPQQKVRANFFAGGKIPVEEAWRAGSVEKIVPLEHLRDEAFAMCEIIAAKSRAALVIAKQALNLIEPVDIAELYRIEQGFTLEMYMHEDSQRARDAFVDKKAQARY